MEIRNILIGMFATCSLMASAQERKNVIDEVIWVVGDEAILKSDVENTRMEFLQQGQRFEGDPYCVIPEQLAVQKLFLHQAAIDSVTVSDADVFQEVDMRLNAVLLDLGSREKLEEYQIKYHRIRIATPRHNGKVERQHRIDQQRFYDRLRMFSLEDGRKQLAVYQKKSNDYIKHCLGLRSPNQVLADYLAVM